MPFDAFETHTNNIPAPVKEPKHEPEVVAKSKELHPNDWWKKTKLLDIDFTELYSSPRLREQTVEEILIKAREIISEKGWGRGSHCQVKGGERMNYCILGSLMEVENNMRNAIRDEKTLRAAELIRTVICQHHLNRLNGSEEITSIIPYYNDIIAQSKEDILSVFDCAIQYAQYDK